MSCSLARRSLSWADLAQLWDGDGSRWWDGRGSNGGKTKPKFFKLSKVTGGSTVKGITIKDSPVQIFSVSGCSDLTLDSIRVDNSAGDTGGGHNTDAFDVGTSTGITISNAHVENQDDCLAINSGSDITFTGGYCSGGHGLSIGSVGGHSDNDVSNILITNSQIVNSANGVRIKTVSGATGSVTNVTYSDITLSGITDYGIVVEQDYENGSPTGTPTNGVPITDLTVSGITGTVESDAQDVYILCASLLRLDVGPVSRSRAAQRRISVKECLLEQAAKEVQFLHKVDQLRYSGILGSSFSLRYVYSLSYLFLPSPGKPRSA